MRLIAHALVVVAALAVLPGLGGCNIIAPVAYLTMGQEKKPAEYTLEDRSTVVFVDDRANVIGRTTTRRMIGEQITRDLIANELITEAISSNDALRLARQESDDAPMSIDQIGARLGAEQVIYVEILQFQSMADPYTPRPVAACRVRVIDVLNRRRLFPDPDAPDAARGPGRTLNVTLREVSEELYRSPTGIRQLEESLAVAVGIDVARLFYKHTPRELGSNLEPR